MTEPAFRNEPPADFAQEQARRAMREAVEKALAAPSRDYPLIVGKHRLPTHRWLTRENPSRLRKTVGRIACAETAQAEHALDAASAAFPAWRALPVAARAGILRKAAALIRQHRYELAACEVVEVGKPWAEADADVAEAIDFLMYYAQQMQRWTEQAVVGQVPGETNLYLHEPLGPGVVIAPWNFPLAILAGMASAALAAGNTVVLKPAEQASITAYHFTQILLEAGVPPGAVNYLPGIGREVGEHLVRSPRVHWIAFTGSKEVGLRIVRAAAELGEGQHWVKRVIAEMGGKNAIVVDADADLDEAVLGVAASAFGYQGQKCSACSRAIVLEPVFQPFMRRLVETVRSLPIGPADDPGTVIGPVVDRPALERIASMVERAKRQSRLAFEAQLPPDLEGHFVAPAVFTDVHPSSQLAQEELFGPVLAVFPAETFQSALGLANGLPYALTGGLYSRSPAHIEQAKREFLAGNLYVNRKITGAAVGRQPFGGLQLSGIGQKAGGPDYLLQFLQARTITENTQRHGFAPLDE